MKINKYIYILCCLLLLNLVGCSDDNDDTPIIDDVPKLKLSQTELSLSAGSTVPEEVTIIDGAGNYKAFSTNPDIASVILNDVTLSVEGKGLGEAKIVVSDEKNQFAYITVNSQYSVIKFDQEVVDLPCVVGNSGRAEVRITEGNGDYTIEVVEDDEAPSIYAMLQGEDILIFANGDKEGQARIKVVDRLGVEGILLINIRLSADIFDSELIEAIKSMEDESYFFNDDVYQLMGDKLNNVEGDLHLYGWDSSDQYYKVWINGDLNVGDKPNSKIDMLLSDADTEGEYSVEICKIIKNDGEKIWCVFSGVKDQELIYGFFITPIK